MLPRHMSCPCVPGIETCNIGGFQAGRVNMFHMSYTVNDQICRLLECGSQEEFTTNDALLQSQCYAAALLIRQYNVRQPIGGN
jgi:hypothetical protein